jgi:AraC-like DNA-binding protein
MGLKEIADACGFQTPLAMRRTFLRVLGITAGEYANRFSGRKARPKLIDEANAGYLITRCMLVARGAARAIST